MALRLSKENGPAGRSVIASAAKPFFAIVAVSTNAAAVFTTDLRSKAVVICLSFGSGGQMARWRSLCAKRHRPVPRLGGEKGAEGFLADGFVANRGAHEIIQEPKATKTKSCLDNAADEGIELQEAAERPSRRPGRADHFRADQNGNRDEGRNMDPVDLLRFSHSGSLHLNANSGKSPPPRGHSPLYHQGAPDKPLAEAQTPLYIKPIV